MCIANVNSICTDAVFARFMQTTVTHSDSTPVSASMQDYIVALDVFIVLCQLMAVGIELTSKQMLGTHPGFFLLSNADFMFMINCYVNKRKSLYHSQNT